MATSPARVLEEIDLSLVKTLENLIGAEFTEERIARVDWARVFASSSWPSEWTQETLRNRCIDLFREFHAAQNHAGRAASLNFASLKTFLQERDNGKSKRKEPSSSQIEEIPKKGRESEKWLSFFEEKRADRNWIGRVDGRAEFFELEFLYQLARENLGWKELESFPLLNTKDPRLACRLLFEDLIHRGLSVQTRPSLDFKFSSLSTALLQLRVSLPPWLLSLWQSAKDTNETREALLQGLFSLQTAQVEIVTIRKEETRTSILWNNRRIPLFILASYESRFTDLLQVEGGSEFLIFRSPTWQNLAEVSLDGSRLFPRSQELHLALNTREFGFTVENQRVTISLQAVGTGIQESSQSVLASLSPIAIPSLFKCSICGQTLSSEEQEQHLEECTFRQAEQERALQKQMLSIIDERLRAHHLMRNEVPPDGYCLLRALLLAQGKPSDQSSVISLLHEIWNYAKERKFSSLLLTQHQREELMQTSNPESHLSQASFSSSLPISSDSSFDAFWNIVYYWAAPVLSRDIYLVTEEARTCTIFPRDGAFSRQVSFSVLTNAFSTSPSSMVALLHLTKPTLHIDWLSFVPPPLPGEDNVISLQAFSSSAQQATPSSPVVPCSGSPLTLTPRPEPLPVSFLSPTSPKSQLDLLLSGSPLNLTESSPPGWWSSLDSVIEKFRSSTGSIVWYSRSKGDPNLWHQHKVGEIPPDCPFPARECTLFQWLSWRQQAATCLPSNLCDLYYLIDVDVSDEDLDSLNRAIPLLELLDDRTSPYSLHSYLRKACPSLKLPDLRPRLYFAPGLLPGVVSTSLHLDGSGHMMSYHWNMGFGEEAKNLVDVYPSEEQLGSQKWSVLRSIAGAAMSPAGLTLPHAVSHSSIATLHHGCDEYDQLKAAGISPTREVELRSGEILLLPAGEPHAFKKWSTSPLVSFAGDIAWLGETEKEASKAIELMMRVEKTLERSYCLPELSMLACLLLSTNSPSAVTLAHLTAFSGILRLLILEEVNLISNLSNFVAIEGILPHQDLWTCLRCKQLILNAVVWSQRPEDETFCLECFGGLGLKPRGKSKRARGSDDFRVSFRFDYSERLLKLLNERFQMAPPEVPPTQAASDHIAPASFSPPSVPPPAPTRITSTPPPAVPSPENLLSTLSDAIILQKIDDQHRLCQAGLAAENDQKMSKDQREQLLLLNRDLPRFCHSKKGGDSVCPLVSTEEQRTQAYEEEFRRKFRCSLVIKGNKCNKVGTWERPLYSCPGEAHQGNRYSFHLDCGGYREDSVPCFTKLLCPLCLRGKRQDRPLESFRKLHFWETVVAPSELYSRGYRLIEIPLDGLCFFTVLFMMSKNTSTIPPPEEVRTWLCDQPKKLLLDEVLKYDVGHPIQQAEFEVLQWPSRSLDSWKSEWDYSEFDTICSILPKLLQDHDVLGNDYYRFSYDPQTQRGSWFDVNGTRFNTCQERFAVLFTETPIAHYTLLERINNARGLRQDELDLLNDGGKLSCNVIEAYLKQVLAKQYPSCYYVDPSFYTKLSETKNPRSLLRWFKGIDFERHRKIFVPIHQPGHWCLVVVDFQAHQLEYYDSLSRPSSSFSRRVEKDILHFLKLLLTDREQPTVPKWRIEIPNNRPFQENGVDCGVFVCAYARCRSQKPFNTFDFTTSDIPLIRARIKEALMCSK